MRLILTVLVALGCAGVALADEPVPPDDFADVFPAPDWKPIQAFEWQITGYECVSDRCGHGFVKIMPSAKEITDFDEAAVTRWFAKIPAGTQATAGGTLQIKVTGFRPEAGDFAG